MLIQPLSVTDHIIMYMYSAKDVPEADPSVQEITTDQEQPPPTTQEKDQIIDYQT